MKIILGGLKSIGVGLGIAGNPLRTGSKKILLKTKKLWMCIYLRCQSTWTNNATNEFNEFNEFDEFKSNTKYSTECIR